MAYQTVGVIGAGAWGTALAEVARRAGRDTLIWAHESTTVDEINTTHTNRVYLPDVPLDAAIRATSNAAEIGACDIILMVAPSQFVRGVAAEFAPYIGAKPVLICTKGFEQNSNKMMSDVVAESLPQATPMILAGPSFAAEVARGLPAALTLAARDQNMGMDIVAALGSRTLRIYWTDDMLGVQLGGAVKNVLAIASGIVVGRQLGANAQAALIARGFAEMMRFGIALGARGETLSGLSGLGDLILTCSSAQSRNMSLGLGLGEGKTLAEVLGPRKTVSEGAHSAAAAVTRARSMGIELPICDAVRAVLAGEMDIPQAIDALMSRPFRGEAEGFYPASR
jgi:glycerol-3-phosphate dehydrogenase (NAD(P)+)